MNKLKFVLVVVMTMGLFVSCREDEPEVKASDPLYLKPAEDNEKTYAESLNGSTKKYYYPNNILFRIGQDSANVINNKRVKVKSFQYLPKNRIILEIFEINSDSFDNNSDSHSIYAKKLPIYDEDHAQQSEEGDECFNGILKVDNYVFAVNMAKGDIKIYDINTDKSFVVKGAVHLNALYFKIDNKIWQMWRTSISPVGNVFQGLADGKQFLCYTLSL